MPLESALIARPAVPIRSFKCSPARSLACFGRAFRFSAAGFICYRPFGVCYSGVGGGSKAGDLLYDTGSATDKASYQDRNKVALASCADGLLATKSACPTRFRKKSKDSLTPSVSDDITKHLFAV